MSLFSLLSLLLSLGVNSLRQTYTTLLLRRRLHYIRTSVYVVFSGTSTIYFIRPKHCALLVQSNTRENSFLFFCSFFCSFFLFPFLPLYLCESTRILAVRPIVLDPRGPRSTISARRGGTNVIEIASNSALESVDLWITVTYRNQRLLLTSITFATWRSTLIHYPPRFLTIVLAAKFYMIM